jgi:hypothetical protein
MNLELKVKDNFLPKELFEKLVNYSITLEYSSKNIVSGYDQHVFLSNLINKNDNLIKEIEECIVKHFNVKIKNLHVAAFTCVNTKKATPHRDASLYPNEKHMIIYLHGDSNLNAGTGFYNCTDENVFDLNTAVGFYPNRALIFNADECWHSPLLYTAKDNSPRFSIIIWFEPKK